MSVSRRLGKQHTRHEWISETLCSEKAAITNIYNVEFHIWSWRKQILIHSDRKWVTGLLELEWGLSGMGHKGGLGWWLHCCMRLLQLLKVYTCSLYAWSIVPAAQKAVSLPSKTKNKLQNPCMCKLDPIKIYPRWKWAKSSRSANCGTCTSEWGERGVWSHLEPSVLLERVSEHGESRTVLLPSQQALLSSQLWVHPWLLTPRSWAD